MSVTDGLILPLWSDVENRKYDERDNEHLIIDTAGRTEDESVSDLMLLLKDYVCEIWL